MKKIVFLFLIAGLSSCISNTQKGQDEETVLYETPSHHSENITKIFDAHGGFEEWSKMKSLSYSKGEESTVTNLKSRKIRIESPTQVIGFNGSDVWITPDSLDASRARFYHNLYFYFYSMPFVVGDPGVFYENVEAKEIKGKLYNGVQISYDNGVGDSPKDNYIIWTDPKTNLMEWLMYTVTFRSGEKSENFSLIKYSDWAEFNGLTLPRKLEWYTYENDVVGDVRNEAIFENISISETSPNEEIFEVPENAQIAPPPPAR